MDFTIEQRVTSLETKVVTEWLLTGAKAVEVARIKGHVFLLPTWWMLMVTVLRTWMVGTRIVFTLVKATHP